MQTDILDGRPDNGQTTGLRREGVNLIGTLPHIAEETFDSIGGLNVPVHALRELIKREGLLFFLLFSTVCQMRRGELQEGQASK